MCYLLTFSDAANSISSPPIMPFSDFYNLSLEHIDYIGEYRTWQNYGNSTRSENGPGYQSKHAVD